MELLTVDIGNTSAKFGKFGPDGLREYFKIGTDTGSSPESLEEELGQRLVDRPIASIIGSVVPSAASVFAKAIERVTGETPLIADHDLDFGFEIFYSPREDCGIDRLLAASGAVQKVGFPTIVCDFGTATTIDVLDTNCVFSGGTILAGIGMLSDSLHETTASLPLVEPSVATEIIGTSTVEAIRSGTYFGYVGAVDAIIDRIKGEVGIDTQVISTGGYAQLIGSASRNVARIEPYLILEGLKDLYLKNK